MLVTSDTHLCIAYYLSSKETQGLSTSCIGWNELQKTTVEQLTSNSAG